ncbi:hypothetical protein GJ744_004679 [Endocarpon pusillum]|uniref:Peptidase C14 caspase domain-containing protein n=1 Tax=Endocarpon pusillum TaxID=364733 RepID=A0A8H7A9I6_9EURO|nr:hypothetical protein GJ744_004679 [Endocarpon pusillum]
MSPLMPPTPSPGPSPPSTGPSFRTQIPLAESPVEERELHPEVRKGFESINIHGQLQWEKHMKDVDLQRTYRKVSVLLIHWEKEGTDSFDAQTEVDRLKTVLSGRYKFHVTERKLNTKKMAQLQINMHLANFLYQEDDENTLLIIYYAGHGTPDQSTGRLLLANGNPAASDVISDRLNHIVWQEAEGLIHTASRPDIFLIFDCCHAGRLLNTRQKPVWSDRIFEFLGATGPDGTTPLPGKDSFTSALIWALEQLADEHARFMSNELLEKILKAPGFSEQGQVPCMNGRGPHCVRKLILEPMDLDEEKAQANPERGREEASEIFKYCLNLQFLLPDAPKDKDIQRLCGSLRESILTDRICARQILWQGLYPKEHARAEFPRLVREFAARWQNKSLKRKIQTLSPFSSHGEEEDQTGTAEIRSNVLGDNEKPVTMYGHSKRGFDELDAPDSPVNGHSARSKRLHRARD